MSKRLKLETRFRVDGGKPVRLAQFEPDGKAGLADRELAERQAAVDIAAIDLLQDRLYAEGRQALLVVLQAMDAGGKDGTVRKVFGPVDPLGLRAFSFKRPTEEELAHHFLWRIHRQLPRKGEIALFNRSHYEDVLIARVRGLAPPEVVEQRYGQINAFEKTLSDNSVRIVKLFLHISKEEQRQRLQARVDEPDKRWKFNPGDLEERRYWDDYMAAYELALNRCAAPHAPWHVVPADRKWVRNAVVARIVRTALEEMRPAYPAASFDPATIKVV